eukprot:11028077-Lingulodinium_polyedra.AAC.1
MALGSRWHPPPGYGAPATLTPEQRSAVRRLQQAIRPWTSQPNVAAEGLGRAADKTAQVEALLLRLGEAAAQLRVTLDPYAAAPCRREQQGRGDLRDRGTVEVGRMRNSVLE